MPNIPNSLAFCWSIFLSLFWTSGLTLWARDLLCFLALCLVSKKVSVEHGYHMCPVHADANFQDLHTQTDRHDQPQIYVAHFKANCPGINKA